MKEIRWEREGRGWWWRGGRDRSLTATLVMEGNIGTPYTVHCWHG